MKLIVGLGNPGRTYAKHRHNVGFWVIDSLAVKFKIDVSKNLFGAKVGIRTMKKIPVMLVKPQSYMNLSGTVVSPIMGYYKCSLEDLIVLHDDIDLPLGRLKLVNDSGAGGHNGVKSIIDEIGSSDFCRVRMGVGRPPENMDPANYVLTPFFKEEKNEANDMVAKACEAAEDLIEKGLQYAQMKYN